MGDTQDNPSPGEMTFFEHLDALRPHLLRAGLAIFVFMVAAFLSKDLIIDKMLMGPQSPNFPLNRLFDYLADKWDMDFLRLNQYQLNMINTAMAGQFSLHLKISIVTAIALAVPYTSWEFWRFIKPALTDNELKNSRLFVLYVSLCFFMGLFFGYFIISPLTINFFAGYRISNEIVNMIDISSYLSTIVNLSIACAVVFQLPLLIYFLAKMGIITSFFMKKYRRHAVVLLFILSAIITPPDLFSLFLVVIPLYALYELGIVIAKRVERKKALEEEEFYSDEDGGGDSETLEKIS